MPAIKANALLIKSKLKERGSYTVQGHPGLTLASRGDGTGSWRVKYRPPGAAHQRWHTVTNDAKNAEFDSIIIAKDKFLAELKHEKVDPKVRIEAEIAAAKIKGLTFGTLYSEWLERHAKVRKKSWQADDVLWNRHIKTRMNDLTAVDIKRADLAAILDDIASNATGIQANKCQAIISAVFAWAVNDGRLESTPAYRMPKRGDERPRERVLNDDEIRALWKATADAGVMGDAVRLCMMTGQRRSEVAEMPRSELDLNPREPAWTIPSKRTKNKVIHRVPLTRDALHLIKARLVDGSAFVFAGRADSATGAISPDAMTRFIWKQDIGSPRATVHDMRRTVGTRMAAMGVPKDVRAKVLNHVSGARASVTDAVYNQHEGSEDKLRALRLWSLHLRNIVSGKRLHALRWHG